MNSCQPPKIIFTSISNTLSGQIVDTFLQVSSYIDIKSSIDILVISSYQQFFSSSCL